MYPVTLAATIFYLSMHLLCPIAADEGNDGPDDEFDTLVFAQIWPITFCKGIDPTSDQCVLPKQNNQWTVHGIWPTRVKGKYPSFCNNSAAFDPEQIQSIKGDLEQRWTDIIKEHDSFEFWTHEWEKHGTCALLLEPLNSELKYFSKGLELNQEYSISDMLEAADIFPHDTKEYSLDVIGNAVKAKTERNPMIVCLLLDGVQFLEEIRICFDKQLNVIDCDSKLRNLHCKTQSVVLPVSV